MCPRTARLLAALVLVSKAAAAEPSTEDAERARVLFHEGRELIARDAIAEACRKFEESQRLDPSAGTLLNLAVCHEKENRTATAWSELERSLALAVRDGRPDREELARNHMAMLEPKLSRVVIEVPADVAALRDLRIVWDGAPLSASVWRTATLVDPGTHRIEASADGHSTWSSTIDIGADGDRRTIVVPMLDAVPVPASVPVVVAEPRRESSSSTRKAITIALGGVAIAGTAAGTFFGLRALSKRSASDDACTPQCGFAASDLNEQAKSAADASTVFLIVAGASAVATLYLWLTTPDHF